MGESVSPWIPSCNGSIRVEFNGQRSTSDNGVLLLREALDNSGVIEALEDNLVDQRHPLRIRHRYAPWCYATASHGLNRPVWRLASLKNGERLSQLTLDIDGLPIEVHGHQGCSAFHGLYGARIYSPLVASLAETGDMVGGLLREGNTASAAAANAADKLWSHSARFGTLVNKAG